MGAPVSRMVCCYNNHYPRCREHFLTPSSRCQTHLFGGLGFRDDEITAVIRRTTTIDPEEGPRGAEFTLEGKGYQQGTVTIYEDKNKDEKIDAGETLTSVKTSRGAFSVTLTALGEYGDPTYRVRTRDSYGADDSASFTIRSSIAFEPASVNVGANLRITIFDWEDDHHEVVAVRIAGQPAHLPASVMEFDSCFDYTGVYRPNSVRTVFMEVTVPKGVPPGEQTVSVYDHEQLDHFYGEDMDVPDPDKGPCADLSDGEVRGSATGRVVTAELKKEPNPIVTATIEIEAEGLVLSPSTAARGQKVTIVGSGFTRSRVGQDDFKSVTIDGNEAEGTLSRFEVGTNGGFALTTRVPLEVRNGEIEVRVVGWDETVAQTFLTIPVAELTLDPEGSGRGSEVAVNGTGFIAGRAVRLHYGDGVDLGTDDAIVGVAMADAQGSIATSFTVPYSATVGRTHRVTAVALPGVDSLLFTIEAEAGHTAMDANVSTAPVSVSSGDIVKVNGRNFPAFTLVAHLELGGVGVVPRWETTTDKTGSFEAEVLVPQLELGDQVLRVQVGLEIAIHVIEIVDPPLSGPTSQVFKMLIRVGRTWPDLAPRQRHPVLDLL